VSHKNFTYFSFYGSDLIVVFLVFYVHVHHRSRSKEIKNNHFWNYTGPSINLSYRAVGSYFLLGGWKRVPKARGNFFKFRVFEKRFPGPCSRPPPVATYGPGLHAEMQRMANKDYYSKVLLDIFFRPFILARYFFKVRIACPIFFWGFSPPPPPHQKSNGPSLIRFLYDHGYIYRRLVYITMVI
jgi:hypothetical protein